MAATKRGWEPANGFRSIAKMQRRAVFLAALGSGLRPERAANRVGISMRTAKRYRQGTGL